ncbi:hypothetical protein [Streptomyces sp. NPDC001770]
MNIIFKGGATAVCAALLLSVGGCAVESPSKHSERLQKASGLKVFQIDTNKELWKKTSNQRAYTSEDLRITAKVKALDNGLERVELSGVGLANYLRQLDHDAHGGDGDYPWSRRRDAESIRMYDEISAVLDRITERPDPKAPPLRVVVDTAFFDAKSRP